ncbi:dephospho-CoA kinase, partial [Acidisphaera rubrifaciens]
VLDIPLLFETGGRRRVDRVVVVSAPPAVQRHRVRLRGKMDEAQISAIIGRQMPDREKRRLADHVVQTGLSRHHAQRAIRRLVRCLTRGGREHEPVRPVRHGNHRA